MKKSPLTFAGIAALVAVVGGGSALALATPSPSPKVYQGCLNRVLGTLYNVSLNPSSPPRCLPHDSSVTWNQGGPTGPAGPQGAKGDTGPAGAQGAKGDTGPAGPQGDRGPAGPSGAGGAALLNGSGPPTADVGNKGDFYIDTSTHTLWGPKGDPSDPVCGPQFCTPPGDGWDTSTKLVGPQGDPGPQGPPGVVGLFWRQRDITLDSGTNLTFSVACDPGNSVYGGGAWIEKPGSDVKITETAPSDDLTSWTVEFANNGDRTYAVHAYALCGPGGLVHK